MADDRLLLQHRIHVAMQGIVYRLLLQHRIQPAMPDVASPVLNS